MNRVFVMCAAVLVLTGQAVSETPEINHTMDPAFIKAQIKDILAQPEYNRVFERKPTLWDSVQKWLDRVIEAILRRLMDPLGFSAGVGRTVSLVLASVTIVVFAVLFVVVATRFSARYGKISSSQVSARLDDTVLSSSRLIKQAAELARQGDYRGAFLKAYLASIVYLDEIEALRIQNGRTNWEYLRDLQRRGFSACAETLRAVTQAFDRKVYGGESVTIADYENACQAYDALQQRAAA